jgi:methionyl-tRNA formyltransferase
VLASPELLDHPTAQTGESTYAEKLSAETFRLAPTMTVDLAWRTVRLGRAFFFLGAKRIGALEARPTHQSVPSGELLSSDGEVTLGLSDGALVLVTVRPEGSSTMAARAWWGGLRPAQERRTWT